MAITIPESPLAGQRIETQTGRQQIRVPSPVKGQGLIALGRGVERLGVATARVDYHQRLEEERQRREEERQRDEVQGKADRSMAYDRVSAFSDRLREGEGDYLSRKLGAASGVYNEAKTFADDRQREFEEQFQNDDQKLMFNSLARTHRASFLNSMDAHERIQIERWDKKSGELQVNDGVRTAIDHYLDKDVVPTVKASIQIGLERMLPGVENAKLRGAEYKAKVSEIHEGIISRFLANDPLGGQLYYDKNKEQILSEKKIEIETKLKHGLTEQRAQNEADLIVNSGISYAEQLAKANKIKEAPVRKLVVQSVKARKAEADFVEKELYANQLDGVTRAALNAPGLEAALRLARNPNLTGADQLKLEKTIYVMWDRRTKTKPKKPIVTDRAEMVRIRRLIDDEQITNENQLLVEVGNSANDAAWQRMLKYFNDSKKQLQISDATYGGVFRRATGIPPVNSIDDYDRSFEYVQRQAEAAGVQKPTDLQLRDWTMEWQLSSEEPGEIKGGLGFGRGKDITWGEASDEQRKTWLPDVSEEEIAGLDEQIRATGEQPPYSDFMRRVFKRVSVLGFEFTDELKVEFREGAGK